MNHIKKNIFLAYFIIIITLAITSSERNTTHHNNLEQLFRNKTQHRWSKKASIYHNEDSFMIADIQTFGSGKKLLLGILGKNKDNPHEESHIMDERVFTYILADIRKCFGCLRYSARSRTIFFPVAVKNNDKVYIIEHGFEIMSKNSLFYRSLQLSTSDDDVAWKRSSTAPDQIHLKQLLHFPRLLAVILRESGKGILGGNEYEGCVQKFIHFSDVELPKDYHYFKQHPLGDDTTKSWKDLPQDFQNLCVKKYELQHKNKDKHEDKKILLPYSSRLIDRSSQFDYKGYEL